MHELGHAVNVRSAKQWPQNSVCTSGSTDNTTKN